MSTAAEANPRLLALFEAGVSRALSGRIAGILNPS
jgi:hypothetical protein